MVIVGEGGGNFLMAIIGIFAWIHKTALFLLEGE